MTCVFVANAYQYWIELVVALCSKARNWSTRCPRSSVSRCCDFSIRYFCVDIVNRFCDRIVSAGGKNSPYIFSKHIWRYFWDDIFYVAIS